MNNNPDEAYNSLFRSYEAANRELAELKKRVVELEAQLAAAQADTSILDWLADYQVLEGFVPVDYDVHEVAGWIAEQRDADAEPSVEDYRQSLRRLVRAAMCALYAPAQKRGVR